MIQYIHHTTNIVSTHYIIFFRIEILKLFLAVTKEAHFNPFLRELHPISLEPKSSACFLDNFKSRTRSFNLP
jgi:hypothetical protein